jgi:alpha-ketoglutarate-dependent taurine dioxygenase
VSRLRVVPLTCRIGAEIRGVRLDPDLDASTAAQIHEAWLRHKVVFFRKQTHLDDEAQEGLAWIFGGEAVAHPTVPSADGTAFTYELDSKIGSASYWHTDLTWSETLPRGSILRAVELPACGGDTLWANTATAYSDLPPRLRAVADRSWAVHANGSRRGRGAREADGESDGEREFWSAFQSTLYETRHPVVHVHPETQEPCLLLGRFTRRLVGMRAARSNRLYRTFQAYVTRPENTMRWRWAVGDVAVWDNRATQHYAVADYGEARRIMRRVSIDGEPTVGLDGRRACTVSHDRSDTDAWARTVG